MDKILQIQQQLLRFQRLPWLVAALTLSILAAVILSTTLQLRRSTRHQIASRDGEILHAVALLNANDPELETFAPLTDPDTQLDVILKTSQLKGVIAARLFDVTGQFLRRFPIDVTEGALPPRHLERLVQRRLPVSSFHPALRLETLFMQEQATAKPNQAAVPVLEVNVPIQVSAEAAPLGIAQFMIQGHGIAAEFAQLDRNLALQATAAFLVAGLILVVAIGWAFRRLRQANRLLADRTDNLLKANEELALAARTSALGAVTAHLIHGLKNPLSGLQNFVSNSQGTTGRPLAADYDQAVASTRRMESMINQVVNILREDRAGTHYELGTGELVELASRQVAGAAQDAGVALVTRLRVERTWPNRVANLAGLILTNLLRNALEASPRGTTITLTVSEESQGFVFEVADQGSGFPRHLNPFAPCQSSKEGGSGIGLAVSKQLANHLGASLELRENSIAGCRFILTLPATLQWTNSGRAPSTLLS